MQKTYISKSTYLELVTRANEVLPDSTISMLKRIGKKHNLELIYDKQTNLQLFWNVVLEKLRTLPADDRFCKILQEEWKYANRLQNINVIKDFIAYLRIQDEYDALLNFDSREVALFFNGDLARYGVPTIGITAAIRLDGNYEKFFGQYLKDNCDPAALRTSKKLQGQLDEIFKGMDYTERHRISCVVRQYATGELDTDQFHNLLFEGQ